MIAKQQPDPSSSKAESPAEPASAATAADGVRETIEAIVVAFILAFIFRTFVAEAFVIPTGSMATTLMGRHRDLECPNCGFPYQVGDSENPREPTDNAACALCRFTVTDLNTKLGLQEFPAHNGDRIIVTKFSYALGDPQRWDVGVFRYPLEAATNYIKRIVGVPNEWLRIMDGDLQRRPLQSTLADYKIERKPPEKVVAMLRMVYDNDYIVDRMTQGGWPPRWQVCPQDLTALVNAGWPPPPGDNQAPLVWSTHMPAAGSWTTTDGFRTFSTTGGADPAWLRYRHFLPNCWPTTQDTDPTFSVEDLSEVQTQPLPPLQSRRPEVIRSQLSYNQPGELRGLSYAWVSDLALECQVECKASQGQLIFELVKGGERFQARLDLQAGKATLGRANGPGPLADTYAEVSGTPTSGRFHVRFANVDHKLYLWINDSFVAGADYDIELWRNIGFPPNRNPPDADHSPVGIASVGVSAAVSQLRVLRDIYYNPGDRTPPGTEYRLGPDEFFAMGDNTDASSDSRYWRAARIEAGGPLAITPEMAHTVHRDMLIGKALLIYWPHSWSYLRPNFGRMGFIR